MEYGVTTKNKFAFLSGGGEDDDVADPTDIAGILASGEPAPKAKEKPAPKSPAVPTKKSASTGVSGEKKSQQLSRENKENDVHPAKTQLKSGGPTSRGPRGPRNERPKNDEPRDLIGDRFGETPRGGAPQGNRRGDANHGGHDSANRRMGGGPRPFRGAPRGAPGGGGGAGFTRRPRNENAQDGAPAPTDTIAPDRPDGGNQQQDGARGGNNFNRPRVFNNNTRQRTDRSSGSNKTGVKSVPKREGAGKGNWGSNTDEVTGAAEPTQTSEEESKKTEGAVGDEKDVDKAAEDVNAERGDNATAEKDEEEEKVRLTLEEWKAQHKVEKPQFNVRKAGEGSDQKIYQNFVPIVKTASEEPTSPVEEEEEHASKVKRTRQKQLEIEVRFGKAQRNMDHGAGMRGGRGGDRGGFRGGDSSDYRNSDRGGAGGGGGRGFQGERRGGGSGGGFPRGGGGGANGGRRPYNDAGRPHAGSSSHGGQSGAAAFNLSAEAFPALGAQ